MEFLELIVQLVILWQFLLQREVAMESNITQGLAQRQAMQGGLEVQVEVAHVAQLAILGVELLHLIIF